MKKKEAAAKEDLDIGEAQLKDRNDKLRISITINNLTLQLLNLC